MSRPAKSTPTPAPAPDSKRVFLLLRKLGLDALCGYVWPDDAPTKRALRWRRAAVRRSLRELQGFERPWTVAEYERGKFAIARPGRPQVEVITGEIE